jgi:phosphopantetheinyl transferase (holo-ACP synthase)
VINSHWATFKNPLLITESRSEMPEQEPVQNQQLTLIWSCKEAVFKWYGFGHVDFKGHMQVQHLQTLDNKLFQTTIRFTKEDRLLGLQSLLFNELCLSFLAT